MQRSCNRGCADPSSPPCLLLVRSDGSSCDTVADGRSCYAVAECAKSSACRPTWLSSNETRQLLRGRWLLFIGDSDTRGLVLLLLQQLAEAYYGRAEAASNRTLWLGWVAPEDAVHSPWPVGSADNYDASRVCHLDYVYHPVRGITRQRVVPCLEAMAPGDGSNRSHEDRFIMRHSTRASVLSVRQKNATYSAFGRDYNFSSRAVSDRDGRAAGGGSGGGDGSGGGGGGGGGSRTGGSGGSASSHTLRVTFIQTSTRGQFMETLKAVGASLDLERSKPSMIYANTGAWHAKGQPPISALVDELHRFGARHAKPHSRGGRLYWGTVVGHRVASINDNPHAFEEIRRDAAATLAALPPSWRVLNRMANYSLIAGRAGFRGMRLSYAHQPHIVNYLDLQRLLASLAASEEKGEEDAADGAGGASLRGARHSAGVVAASTLAAPCAARNAAGAKEEQEREPSASWLVYNPECAGLGAARRDRHFLEAYQHFCTVSIEPPQPRSQ